jgi:hypothetical protein
MSPATAEVLSRFIGEYALIVGVVNDHEGINDEFDRGWVSAWVTMASRFHGILSEFQVEVSPPPDVVGRHRATIRFRVH